MSNTVKQCINCNTSEKIFKSFNKEEFRELFDFWEGFIALNNLKVFCKNESYNQDFENNICPFCKGELVDTLLTFDDFRAIGENSNTNRNLLLAMIELRKKDVIEFETKMQPFREASKKKQDEREHKRQEYLAEKNKPHCPTCGSTNIKHITGSERAVSVIGLGIFSKKINKTYKCLNCKYTW